MGQAAASGESAIAQFLHTVAEGNVCDGRACKGSGTDRGDLITEPDIRKGSAAAEGIGSHFLYGIRERDSL